MINKLLKAFAGFSTVSIRGGINGNWMTNFIDSNKPFYLTDHYGVLRIKLSVIKPKYISLILYEVGKKTGSKRSYRAPTECVHNLAVNLPTSNIQKKIVKECEKVNEEYSSAEKAIQSNKSKIANMMNVVHEHGWPVLPIGNLTTELQHDISEKSLAQGKVPVIRMDNMQDGFIVWDDLVYSDNEEDIAKYSLRKNDVLYNRTNVPKHVRKIALYRGEQPAIFAGYIIRVKYIPEKIDPIYLAYILNSDKIRQYVFSIMSESINQANISSCALDKYKIKVSPLEEQKTIAAEVSSYEVEIIKAHAVMDSVASRKQAILQKHGIILTSPDTPSSNP